MIAREPYGYSRLWLFQLKDNVAVLNDSAWLFSILFCCIIFYAMQLYSILLYFILYILCSLQHFL